MKNASFFMKNQSFFEKSLYFLLLTFAPTLALQKTKNKSRKKVKKPLDKYKS